MYFRFSCALTLARKFKVKACTLAATFRKFGPDLAVTSKTPEGTKSRIKFYRPDNLRILPIDKRFSTENLELLNIDNLLSNL